jgi:hypothetical protein
MAETQSEKLNKRAPQSQSLEVEEPVFTSNRKPGRNTGLSIHFIIRGAEKRRGLAYAKAKMLQRELGVIPRLICVK